MKALIVDDSQACGSLLEFILNNEGIDTVWAMSGSEALTKLGDDGGGYDMVISDVVMPGMTGLDLFRSIRSHEKLSDLPTALISGQADRDMVLQAAKVGCRNFLLKPVTPDKVRIEIRKMVPHLRAYLRHHAGAIQELRITAEEYETVLQDLRQMASSALDAANSNDTDASMGIAVMSDGVKLLGTHQFQEIFESLKSNYDHSRTAAHLKLFLEEIDASLEKVRIAIRRIETQAIESGAIPSIIVRKTQPIKVEQLAPRITPSPALAAESARRDLLLAAKQGKSSAQFSVGMAMLRGDGFECDPVTAHNWLVQAAKLNHPRAHTQLGLLALGKCASEKDISWMEADTWLTNASRIGCKDAKYWSGLVHQGIKKDNYESAYLLTSATQGDMEARYRIGVLYDRGDMVLQDNTEAVYWLTASASTGHTAAQHRLGLLYESGRGGECYSGLAIQWFEQAAELNYLDAQLSLARALEYGLGVAPNKSAAQHWYEIAARRGSGKALFSLGALFEDPCNIMADPFEAAKWYLVSSKFGNATSHRKIDSLKMHLDPQKFAFAEIEAERIATNIKANNS